MPGKESSGPAGGRSHFKSAAGFAAGLRYASGPRVEGYNISGGRPVFINTYRSERR